MGKPMRARGMLIAAMWAALVALLMPLRASADQHPGRKPPGISTVAQEELTPDPNAPGPPGAGDSTPIVSPASTEAPDDSSSNSSTVTYVLLAVIAVLLILLLLALRGRRGRSRA